MIVPSLLCLSAIQFALSAPRLTEKWENSIAELDAAQESVHLEIDRLTYYTENFKLDEIESERIAEIERKLEEISSKDGAEECRKVYKNATLTVEDDSVKFYRGSLQLLLRDVNYSVRYVAQSIPLAETEAEFARLEAAVTSLIEQTRGLAETALRVYLTPAAVDANYRRKVYEPTVECIDNLNDI